MIRRRGCRAWLLAAAVLVLAACHRQPAAKDAGDDGEGVADATAAASTANAASPTGLVPGKGDQILTITSDDPSVAITGVFLDGKAMKTAGLGKASVRALLAANREEGYGTPCDSDGIELRLANGVIYRPQVDFCRSHYLIRAAAKVSRLPASLPPVPEGFVWQTVDSDGDRTISFGLPETDATALTASCHQGTTRAQLIVFRDAGPRPRIDFYAPDRVLRYDLKRTGDGSEEQPPSDQVALSIANQLFTLLQQGRPIAYRLGGGESGTIETSSGADQINAFIQWCQGG